MPRPDNKFSCKGKMTIITKDITYQLHFIYNLLNQKISSQTSILRSCLQITYSFQELMLIVYQMLNSGQNYVCLTNTNYSYNIIYIKYEILQLIKICKSNIVSRKIPEPSYLLFTHQTVTW